MRTLGLGIALLLAVTACGGGAAAPTTTPPLTQDPTPTAYTPIVTSLDHAISLTVGSSEAVRNSIILAQALTAQESADRTQELGLGSIPMIEPADWKCPDNADCPYPGEPGSERGYLIITRLPGAPDAGGNIHVSVNWISDMSSRETVPDTVMSGAAVQ